VVSGILPEASVVEKLSMASFKYVTSSPIVTLALSSSTMLKASSSLASICPPPCT